MIKVKNEKTARKTALLTENSGFTLVEILFALVIIAIISTIAFPIYTGYIDKAKITVSISTLETVRKTIEDYHIDTGRYPPALDISTGEDGQGKIVLNQTLLAEFKSNLVSLESYSVTAENYTLRAKAKDAKQTLLVLTPGQVITQGP